jgi:cell division septum initiation protein DivIVA
LEIEWLDGLEARVHDAVARLDEMKEENRTLRARIAELEGELAAAAVAGNGGSGAGDWEAEREEVRRRVEALAERLEGLVAE